LRFIEYVDKADISCGGFRCERKTFKIGEKKSRRTKMNRTKTAIMPLVIAMIATTTLLSAANAALISSGILKIEGSSTVLPVSQRAKTAFETHMLGKGITIDVQTAGGGSGAGFSRLAAGTIDVGMASKDAGSSEWNANDDLRMWAVGIDSIAIIVAANSSIAPYIRELTAQQVSDLFCSSSYTTWQDFNSSAPAQQIVRVVRDLGSGTHDCFKTFFLTPFGRNDASLQPYQIKTDNIDVYNYITSPDGQYAIAYIGLGFMHLGGLKGMWIYNSAIGQYVEPIRDNVIAGTYNIKRWLYYMTNDVPTTVSDDKVKAMWISFIKMHPEYIDQEGYIQMYRADFAGRASGDTLAPIHPSLPDGKIDATDTQYYVRAYIAYYSNNEINPYADFNADGQITATDTQAYVRAYISYYAGNPPPGYP
jgi:ABC-type phosphate transport system substrate-binding protein